LTLSISNCTASGAGVSTSGGIQATFTALHVDSSLTLSGAALPSGITASSYARTADTITADPDVAWLGMTFHLNGTLSDSGLGSARIVFSFGFNYDSGGLPGVAAVQCSRSISSGGLTVSLDCVTPLYPIADFTSPYFFSLAAMETNPASGGATGTASANFFDTATLESVHPYDSAFQYLGSASVSSAGNGGTLFAVTPTPEPAAWLCALAGLAILPLLARRPKCSAPSQSR
jgi:hypothetical protein